MVRKAVTYTKRQALLSDKHDGEVDEKLKAVARTALQ